MRTRTKYVRNVKAPHERMLMPGRKNVKLGHRVNVKMWKGLPLYQFSLEERATCPTTCQQWETCYGNNMPFAHRFDHQSKDFNACLEASVAELARKHPKGFVVRLHVLGDFYSDAYVMLWLNLLNAYPMMNVYGYTHRLLQSDTGKLIRQLNTMFPSRWRIRFSDNWRAKFSACVVHPDDEYVPKKNKEVICPEQLGQVDKCVNCGLCWAQEDRRIIFLEH